MSDPVKPEQETLSVPRSIRFTPSQWEKIEAAAAEFSREHGMMTDSAEIVRSGAMRRADEILGAA